MVFRHAKAAKQPVIRVRRRKIKVKALSYRNPYLHREQCMNKLLIHSLALLIIRARRPCTSNNFLIQEIKLTHVRFCYIL